MTRNPTVLCSVYRLRSYYGMLVHFIVDKLSMTFSCHSESADEESHGFMLIATFVHLSRDACPFHSRQAQHDIFLSFRVRRRGIPRLNAHSHILYTYHGMLVHFIVDMFSMTCVDTILDKLGVTYVNLSKQSLIPSSLQTGLAIEGSCCLSMHLSYLVSNP